VIRHLNRFCAPLLVVLWLLAPAAAQAPIQNAMGFCAISSLSSAVGITATNCIFATFTGAVAGTTLTTTSQTGTILPGQPLTGTNVPSSTYVISQLTGTAGQAGTYRLSASFTQAAEAMTTAGVPPYAKYAAICAVTQAVNWRDDLTAPTATAGTGGMPLAAGSCLPYNAAGSPFTAPSKIGNLQFIQQTASAALSISFYGANP
jgi:hypothetical protein